MKKDIIALVLIACISAVTFSQQQSYIHLPENVQIEILLDSTVTKFFDNNIYMDIWERIWIKSNKDLVCFDFMADSLDVNFVALDIQKPIHDICWINNGNMIITDDSSLFLLDDESYQIISYLPYSNMQIAPADTNSIYVFGKSDTRNEYDISLFSLSGEKTRLFSLKEKVKAVLGNGEIAIAVLEKELLLFSPKVEPTVFYRTDSDIRSVVTTDFEGIFIGTSKGIIYFESMNSTYTFCNIGVIKLWNINNKLYTLFDDGNFCIIHPVDNFKDFIQAIK